MKEGFTINSEKDSLGKPYFTVSGKDGCYEYYRLGHFASKIEANMLIATLTEYKKGEKKDDNNL